MSPSYIAFETRKRNNNNKNLQAESYAIFFPLHTNRGEISPSAWINAYKVPFIFIALCKLKPKCNKEWILNCYVSIHYACHQISGRTSEGKTQIITTEATWWRIQPTSDIFSFILSLSPEEKVFLLVWEGEEEKTLIWYVKKKSLENKDMFSPTLITTLNSLIQLQNSITFALTLSLCFSLWVTSKGYFLLLPTAVILNNFSVRNSAPLHLFKSIWSNWNKSGELILHLAEPYKDYMIYGHVLYLLPSSLISLDQEFHHASSLARSQTGKLRFFSLQCLEHKSVLRKHFSVN